MNFKIFKSQTPQQLCYLHYKLNLKSTTNFFLDFNPVPQHNSLKKQVKQHLEFSPPLIFKYFLFYN